MQSAAYAGLIVYLTPSASCIAVRRSYSTRANKMRESTSSMRTGLQAKGRAPTAKVKTAGIKRLNLDSSDYAQQASSNSSGASCVAGVCDPRARLDLRNFDVIIHFCCVPPAPTWRVKARSSIEWQVAKVERLIVWIMLTPPRVVRHMLQCVLPAHV